MLRARKGGSHGKDKSGAKNGNKKDCKEKTRQEKAEKASLHTEGAEKESKKNRKEKALLPAYLENSANLDRVKKTDNQSAVRKMRNDCCLQGM